LPVIAACLVQVTFSAKFAAAILTTILILTIRHAYADSVITDILFTFTIAADSSTLVISALFAFALLITTIVVVTDLSGLATTVYSARTLRTAIITQRDIGDTGAVITVRSVCTFSTGHTTGIKAALLLSTVGITAAIIYTLLTRCTANRAANDLPGPAS